MNRTWGLVAAAVSIAGIVMLAIRWPKAPEPGRSRPRPSAPENRTTAADPKREDPRRAPPLRREEPRRSAYDRILEALRAGDREAILRLVEELLAEIVPPPVPDEENAATLYNEAFEKISPPTEEEQRAIDALRSGSATPDQLALVRAYLDRNHDALRLLREAADRPRCNFNLDYSQGIAMELPHISKMIRAEKLLQIEGIFEGSPDVIRAAHRLSEALLDEPILISQLVRMVNTGIAAYTLGEALDDAGDVAALRTLLERFVPGASRDAYRRSILGEVVVALRTIAQGPPEELLPGAKSLDDALARLDVEHYVRSMQSYEAMAARPYPEVREELERLEREAVEGTPAGSVYGRNLFPAMARSARNQAASEATVAAMRIATAARIFHAMRGYYPVSLDELRAVLPDPPVDPLTGRAFDYRLDGTGFVVSSSDSESSVSIRVRR